MLSTGAGGSSNELQARMPVVQMRLAPDIVAGSIPALLRATASQRIPILGMRSRIKVQGLRFKEVLPLNRQPSIVIRKLNNAAKGGTIEEGRSPDFSRLDPGRRFGVTPDTVNIREH